MVMISPCAGCDASILAHVLAIVEMVSDEIIIKVFIKSFLAPDKSLSTLKINGTWLLVFFIKYLIRFPV